MSSLLALCHNCGETDPEYVSDDTCSRCGVQQDTMTPTWPPQDGYPAEILEVHDGDTFTARLDLGFWIDGRIKIRIAGIDAPELLKPGGPDAHRYLAGLLWGAPGAIRITSHRFEQSFARWVCDITLHGEDLAQNLIDTGHAKPLHKDTT